MQLDIDGHSIFAATGGKPFDPAKPAIIFIHGACLDHTVWKLQTRYFAWRDNSVLAIDLPAHGRSEGPLLETVADNADWIVRLMDAAGLAQAALVGHSMGALIALDTAGRHADRVRALALLGPGYPMRVNDVLLDAATQADRRFDRWTLHVQSGCRRGRSLCGGPGVWSIPLVSGCVARR